MEKKKRRYFPDEFKRQAAERVETSGLSIMDVAAERGAQPALTVLQSRYRPREYASLLTNDSSGDAALQRQASW